MSDPQDIKSVEITLEAKVRYMTFRMIGNGHRKLMRRGSNNKMKIKRVKYMRTTPKSQTGYSQLSLDMGGGFERLLKAAAKIIEKYFGLLYILMYES